MRLVAWNVAGRTDGPRAPSLSRQAEAIADEDPDLVALQEVTRASDEPWRRKLSEIGLMHIVGTVAQLSDGRRYANLLAARWPLTPEPPRGDTEFPEKILSAHIQAPEGDVELHVFHAPTGVGSGWGEVRALEALHRRLLDTRPVARIVCGDFNAPQAAARTAAADLRPGSRDRGAARPATAMVCCQGLAGAVGCRALGPGGAAGSGRRPPRTTGAH